MAEVVQEQVQQPAQQQQTQEAPPQDMSDEGIMSRALGDKPRDAQGRFVGQQQTETQTAPPQEQATTEKPAEQQAQAEEQPEYKWDELKAIKLKIPMKQGDKEWEEELSLEQLRDGRMMQADYTRKQQELSEHRKQVETMTQTAVEKERTAYLTSLGALQKSIIQAASPELANVDWNKLAQENPAEYVRLSNRAREVNAALERVRFEEEKVQTQQANERNSRLAQAVSESQTKLREAIPNWNDALYQSLQKRGIDTYGFKPEEIGDVWDHRVMQVLHDAHQFRLLKEQKQTTDKKVETLPPVLKPGSQKPKVDPKQQEFQQAQNRLRSNGNDNEAAAALMAGFLTQKR